MIAGVGTAKLPAATQGGLLNHTTGVAPGLVIGGHEGTAVRGCAVFFVCSFAGRFLRKTRVHLKRVRVAWGFEKKNRGQ